MLGLLTFGGWVWCKIESPDFRSPEVATLDHHITLLSKNESYLYGI